MDKPQVGIIMGSASDLDVMEEASTVLTQLSVQHELTVVSAHRTPERAHEYATQARERGLKVIIAGAGGAAHLAGVIAAFTTLPVIGVPVRSSISIDGWDSILSTLQMPSGIPVATVGLDAARNAGILAAQIIGTYDEHVAEKLKAYKNSLKEKLLNSVSEVKNKGFRNEFDV